MSPPSANKGFNPTQAEHHKRTLTRIEQVHSHLKNSARGGRLHGKVCVITGAGSLHGIGRASALLFAHQGPDLVPFHLLGGARHLYLIDFATENLPDLKSTIERSYPDVKVTTIQADAADSAAIAAVCTRAIDEEGQLDVFFANAGVATMAGLQETTPERFMETLRINTLSCFLAVKYASQAMMHTNPSGAKTLSGGSIILTASIAGLRSGAGSVDYSASKAAVNSIAQTSVYQLQRTDIRVNSICPGLIETSMTKAIFDAARERGSGGKLGQLNPLGRYGAAQEIAQMALFLASDESSYVNGQNIVADGGLSSSHPVIPGRLA